jgi:diaminopimelate epimerase
VATASLQLTGAVLDGAENVFLLVDALCYTAIEKSIRPKLVRRICQTTVGLKLDGVVFLDPSNARFNQTEKLEFVWDFYNSDGSFAEFCGNAARCVATYYRERVLRKSQFTFRTGAGDVQASFNERDVPRVRLPGKAELICERQFVAGRSESIYFVLAGVPHLILEGEPDLLLAAELRKASSERPSGANVTFVGKDSQNYSAVTYERGVEGLTRACGSGALAAACFLRQERGAGRQVPIQFPGGQLVVDFVEEDGVYLSGPVRHQFDLKMEIL